MSAAPSIAPEQNDKKLTLENLRTAVEKSAAFRFQLRLRPTGGDADKIFPPTYAGGVYAVENRRINGQVVRCVLLDSVQSQANRMEEALLEAFLPSWRELPEKAKDEEICDLPVIAVKVGDHDWVTSLTAPHRVYDAIFRDSELGNEPFRNSKIGSRIVKARLHNALPLYEYCPTALMFGTWDSTAGEGLNSAKIPRAVVSEIIGVDLTTGVRTGSRIDPLGIRAQSATIFRRSDDGWALKDNEGRWIGAAEQEIKKNAAGEPVKFGKGKPADINHGNIVPDMARFDRKEVSDHNLERLPDLLQSSPVKLRLQLESGESHLKSNTELDSDNVRIRAGAVKPGGASVAHALHIWTLSLTQLRRLRFPPIEKRDQQGPDDNEKRDLKLRTVLGALSVYALTLTQHKGGYWLRSRCELVPEAASQRIILSELHHDGSTTPFALPSVSEAKELLNNALNDAKVGSRDSWHRKIVRLSPSKKLLKLVELSDNLESTEEEGEGVGTDARDQD